MNSTKTSSKKTTVKGAKALAKNLQVGGNGNVAVAVNPNNAMFSVGLALQEAPEDKAPLKLLINNKTKPVLVNDEFLIIEGKLESEDKLSSHICLFSQNPYASTYQRFKIGDKFDFIHVMRSDTKTEYVTTLKNCIVKRIEFKVGKRSDFDRDMRPNEQTILGFEERIVDKDAQKLYNMTMGKNR